MNQCDWSGSTDADAMLDWLAGSGRATGRKLRLFAAACCRRLRHLLTDPRSRRAVEVAERFADGLAGGRELKTAFADTIADYIDWCRERGKEPERPYSGNFTVRISPELHRRVATAAARSGKSVNTFVAETLERSA